MTSFARRCTVMFFMAAVVLTLNIGAVPGATQAKVSASQDGKKGQNDLYLTFKKGSTGDANARKAAYEAGKDYLVKFPDEKDPRNKEIKDWIAIYEAEVRGVEVLVNVYKAKKFPEAFQVGKEVLAVDPDNIKILTALGYAGMPAAASGSSEFSADATTYAKKAIQLIEGGKIPADWKPFASKDETLAWLNYSLGVMGLKTAPADSVAYFVKTAQYEGQPKNDPRVYYYLAVLYSQDFEQKRAAYKATYEGKPETPETKAALENVSAVVDLIIDAYARAIAYTDANPQLKQMFQQQEADWNKKITEFYKSRHNNSDAGLKEMIAGIRSKPLPGQAPAMMPAKLP